MRTHSSQVPNFFRAGKVPKPDQSLSILVCFTRSTDVVQFHIVQPPRHLVFGVIFSQ